MSCDEKKSFDYPSSVLSSEYSILSENQKIKYLDSVENKINLIDIDSIKIKALFEIAAEYYYLNNDHRSFKASKKILKIAKKIKDSSSMGRSLYYMGDCYEDFQKDSAYYFYKESEKIFRLIKNDEKLAKALFNKAHLLFTEGNYIESEIEVTKALHKIKNSKNNELVYSCYYLQASNHTELEELEKANEFLDLALINLENSNLSANKFEEYIVNKALIVIGKCNIHDKKKEFNKSIEELQIIITIPSLAQTPSTYSTVLGNLGYNYMKIGNYEKSIFYLNKSISVIKGNKKDKNYLFQIINLGEFYLLKKDISKANQLLTKALILAKELKSGREILKVLNLLSISDQPNSSNHKSEYIRINDSIIKKQRENREKFTRIEYETEKVVEENKILSNNNLLLLLGLLIAIAIFLIILIIRNKNSRRKELDLIQQKEKANKELHDLTKEFQTTLLEAKEDEQKKLSKELHDGIVNKIYGIRMILGSLNKLTDEESQNKRLEYLKELHKLETEIRTLSHYLNSDFTKYIGEFNFLIEQLVHNNNDIGNVTFSSSINTTIDWNNYSSVIKINVYRILQELFLNVNKYANAKNCTLSMNEIDNQLIVEVKDDGKGFDVNDSSFGIGLQNCLERANTINAKFEIQSEVEKGTSVCLKVQLVQS